MIYLIIYAVICFVVSDAFPVINMYGFKGYWERLKRNPDWESY